MHRTIGERLESIMDLGFHSALTSLAFPITNSAHLPLVRSGELSRRARAEYAEDKKG